MTSTTFIQQHLNISDNSITATIKLLSEDCTIPLLLATEKMQQEIWTKLRLSRFLSWIDNSKKLLKRKETILKSVEEQNSLTEDLKQRIENSFNLQEIEDLYLPFKKEKKQKQTLLKKKG